MPGQRQKHQLPPELIRQRRIPRHTQCYSDGADAARRRVLQHCCQPYAAVERFWVLRRGGSTERLRRKRHDDNLRSQGGRVGNEYRCVCVCVMSAKGGDPEPASSRNRVTAIHSNSQHITYQYQLLLGILKTLYPHQRYTREFQLDFLGVFRFVCGPVRHALLDLSYI